MIFMKFDEKSLCVMRIAVPRGTSSAPVSALKAMSALHSSDWGE